jgi:hypothetical protein
MWVELSNERWYQHVPKAVETGHEGNVAILWKQQVQTDKPIPNHKPARLSNRKI